MATKTITVNVQADVEERFRRVAASKHGKKKGYLGRAHTDAMKRWVDQEEASDATAETIKMLEEGLDLGGFNFTRRDELHER